MMDNPRLRLLVGTHGRVLVVVLAVVGLVSVGGAGAMVLNPPTETITENIHEQKITTSTTTSAVVEGNTELWPRGTELENSPVYLMNATPAMTVTAETDVTGADHAIVTHEWVLIVEASHDDEAFWSESETLATETHEGTTARTSATIDVEHVHDRVRTVEAETARAGTVSVTLILVVEYDTDPGTAHGHEGIETLPANFEVDEQSYALAGEIEDETPLFDREVIQVTQPRNWSGIGGLGLFGLLSLFAAAGIYTQRPESIDLDEARNDLHRRRYAQWISTGTIPMGITQQFIELDSLEDVVDVAIDTEQRVVYDERRDLYAVICEHVVYYFSPNGSWMATAFPGMDESEWPSEESLDPPEKSAGASSGGTPSEMWASQGDEDRSDGFDDDVFQWGFDSEDNGRSGDD